MQVYEHTRYFRADLACETEIIVIMGRKSEIICRHADEMIQRLRSAWQGGGDSVICG
jgi:hypothetical protein